MVDKRCTVFRLIGRFALAQHVMLVGEGARMFALEEGLESVEVNSRERYQAWQEQRLRQKAKPAEAKPDKSHDTIALLVLGADGNIAGGCSTSGLGTFSGEQVTMILSKGACSGQP